MTKEDILTGDSDKPFVDISGSGGSMDQRLVYMTAGTEDEAIKLARVLVDERLAACVNVLGAARSFYRWEGEVQDEQEFTLIAKTTSDRLDAFVARVGEVHSYDCPCVVALPIVGGNAEFLDWIVDEAQSS